MRFLASGHDEIGCLGARVRTLDGTECVIRADVEWDKAYAEHVIITSYYLPCSQCSVVAAEVIDDE